ncbi:MAG: hypothetical protein IKW90_01840 [Lachnospiraceae bacterium]|nr:hypothetical protein [Lachnospiraceae bacterium]
MKKPGSFIILLAFILILAGCDNKSSTASRTGNNSASVADILEAELEKEKNKETQGNATEEKINDDTVKTTPDLSVEKSGKIDIDLTALSSTMVYSEVYYMMMTPEDYIGKSVKMDGIFSVYHDEAADKYYFACIIQDATACCTQGIEFELQGDYKYPDDYPDEGTEICVSGIFDTYVDGAYTYCTLRNAKYDEPTL